MKEKLRNAFALLIIVGLFMYFLITAVLALTNKKDLHTINLAAAVEMLEVEHTINWLIPVGSDHYYVGIEEGSYDAYIIKASKKWLGNHFDSNHMAKDASGVQITALAVKVSDYKISEELSSRAAQLEGLNYPLGTDYCLNMGYKAEAIIKLIVVFSCVFLIITEIFYFSKKKGEVKPIFVKCWLAVLLIMVVLLLKLLYNR